MLEEIPRTKGKASENDTVLEGLDRGLLLDAINLKGHTRWRPCFPLGPICSILADRTHLNKGTAGTAWRQTALGVAHGLGA